MALNLRQSIAPRIVDESLPTSSIVSNAHFSVRIAPQDSAPCKAPSSILTTFVWRRPAKAVFVAGSFGDWRKHQLLFVPNVNYHILIVELPPGDYFYRFVVDGRWCIDESDPNLRQDQFDQLSHFVSISPAHGTAQPARFSTAAVSHAGIPAADTAIDHGDSDTESEASVEPVDDAPLPPESPPLPRHRGSTYIGDYDDDAYAGLDLQADVFEAMKDVAEVTDKPPRDSSPTRSHSTFQETSRRRKGPGFRMLRKVWGIMFGDTPANENQPPEDTSPPDRTSRPTHNQKIHGLVTHESALKKGLKVWFPSDRNFPSKSSKGRKVEPSESKEVFDAGDCALKLHQVEENANQRQMVGKNLFAQGNYDASLALFSLSVKLREDNGLKFAKTTAIAHTDVASAFIQLEDLKNAEKHLNMALAIFKKGTFSGGKPQLGDVHCFLGVIGDMRGDFKMAQTAYRKAIELYEKCKATDENPNYATAIENLDASTRRQKSMGILPQQPKPKLQPQQHQHTKHAQPPTRSNKPRTPPNNRHPTPPSSQQSKGSRGMTPNALQPANSRPKSPPPTPPAPPSRPPQQTKPLTPAPRKSGPIPPLPRPLEASRPVPSLSTDSPLASPTSSIQLHGEKENRPDTWKNLADTARASMPTSPPDETIDYSEPDTEPPVGSYEAMCLEWHKEARSLLGEGNYEKAIEKYTLIVFSRKRHGPWATRENANTLVELARALFASKQLGDSVGHLKDAVGILEKMPKKEDQIHLGEVWGNLGSVLDRLGGGHEDEALMAHSAGMVAYGKAGMSSDDAKWSKAWKGLCVHLKKTNRMDKMEEMWRNIDLQIRGVKPMTKVSNVLHR